MARRKRKSGWMGVTAFVLPKKCRILINVASTLDKTSLSHKMKPLPGRNLYPSALFEPQPDPDASVWRTSAPRSPMLLAWR